jgi:lauroyl/myristoyl acyltransferase
MGLRTWLPNGIARFAIASGAPVVAAGAVLDATSRYRVTASAPMHFGGGATVESVMSTVLGALEPLIAEHPSQWFMFRNMWPCEKPSRLEDTTRSELLFGLRSATTTTVPSPQEIILQAGFTIGSLLPREAVEEITGIAGRVAYSVPNNRSVGLSHNLAVVLGQTVDHASVRNSLRASVALHFENYADLLRGSRIGREEIEARSEILGPGWDVVKASIGRGTGAILMSAHFYSLLLSNFVFHFSDIH